METHIKTPAGIPVFFYLRNLTMFSCYFQVIRYIISLLQKMTEKQCIYISLEIFNGIDSTFRNIVKKKWYKYLYGTIGFSLCRCGIKRVSPLQGGKHNTMLSNIYISKQFLTFNTSHKQYYVQRCHLITCTIFGSGNAQVIHILILGLWKNVMIRFTLYLHSSWASALALLETGYWAKQAVGCSYVSISYGILYAIRACFCLFFGPLYKLAFQKRMKGIQQEVKNSCFKRKIT